MVMCGDGNSVETVETIDIYRRSVTEGGCKIRGKGGDNRAATRVTQWLCMPNASELTDVPV